ncbi:MAG TPA: HD domain-containing protein [Thermodesulfobacteriota bacterium]|nr:HD domain-containing protein [Deltaproteobacteria bacterium]HNR11745.1 HD domain-containing protein [Thermodesulfobacteriota bacterium]HNU70180.1 HD domain-containing protein [Thermodesulfobacteriota bacterium]HOC38303.1 HD domain-containing protein [Thermodesulfobacteriota bacterium]HQO78846.1 HD domain-containing protein [Thermodesulfobacteriota bacterium]
MSNESEVSMSSNPGEILFRALYRLLHTIRIHADNNELITSCLVEFRSAVMQLSGEDDVTILSSQARLYLQGERFNYQKQNIKLVHSLLDFFKNRRLQGISFHSTIKNASATEILWFFRLIIRSGIHEEPSDWLIKEVEKARLSWVTVLKESELKPKRSDQERKQEARDIYFHALGSVADVAQKISQQGAAGIRQAKRAVQAMIEFLGNDLTFFQGLSVIRDYDDYTYSHSVNVAVLALCLGHRIGLPPMSLQHLGLCGLFHDLGKVEIPREIITKPQALTEEERNVVKKHPLASVQQILKLQTSSELTARIILAPFEHHLQYDLNGYPEVFFKKTLSLFGRIIRIADVYDAITSSRPYRSAILSPDCALALMLQGSGKEYDPILIKVFAQMLGAYPVGTLMQFNTGELGLVAETGNRRLQVVLLDKDASGICQQGRKVDLYQKDPLNPSCRRAIVRTANPLTYGIRAADFLF